jgi:photosystem II stability/assembly factor-like uncharacterized protein
MSKAFWTPAGPACVLDVDFSDDATQGSGPCSGRVTSIAIDPTDPDKTIYVGTATGGVFRTTDGGLTWTPKTDAAECLSVGTITINGNRIIVGTGEANNATDSMITGVGILISSDGGETWVRKPVDDMLTHTNLFTGYNVIRVLVDPTAPDHWFAATTGGLFETTDAGSHWSDVLILGATDWNLSDAVMDASAPANPILYVAINGLRIVRRIGSAAFETMAGLLPTSSVGRIGLAISPKQPGTLYAVFGASSDKLNGIYRTDNANAANIGDVKWEPPGKFPGLANQTSYNLVIAPSPDDPQVVLFGETQLWRSTDKGRSWALVGAGKQSGIHVDQHAIAFHPSKPGTVWLGNDGGVWLSTDGGVTWAHRNRGLQALQLYSAAQHPQYASVMLGGTQDNGAIRYEGTGAWRESAGGDAFDTAIDPKDSRLWYENYVWGNGGFHPFFRSESAGRDWTDISKNLIASDFPNLGNPSTFVLDSTTPSTIYLASTRLYQSVDSGKTFSPVKIGTGAKRTDFKPGALGRDKISALAAAGNIVYAGTADGQFLALAQAGGVWSSDSRSTGLPAGYISDIAVNTSDTQKVYVAIGSPHGTQNKSFSGGRFFKSADGGKNWIHLTPTFPQVNPIGNGFVDHLQNPVNTIALDPAKAGRIFVGCDVGVFRSEDDGSSWTWWNENLPNACVSQLSIHPKSRLVRAATLGRGVWERSIDAAPAPDVDLYLRDNALDVGLEPTQSGTDPFDPSRQAVWQDGLDLKVDTAGFFGGFEQPASTVNYAGGDIDFIGFDKMPHSNPRALANARVYLQVNNRGPKSAKLVKARLFWAAKTGSVFPDLPADFWTAFENGDDLSPGSKWHSISPSQVLDEIRPAEPGVFSFFWNTSDLSTLVADIGLSPPVGVLAVVSSADDPVNESGLSVATIVPANKHILLKEMPVKTADVAIVLGIIAGLGLLAYGGKLLYDKLQHK